MRKCNFLFILVAAFTTSIVSCTKEKDEFPNLLTELGPTYLTTEELNEFNAIKNQARQHHNEFLDSVFARYVVNNPLTNFQKQRK